MAYTILFREEKQAVYVEFDCIRESCDGKLTIQLPIMVLDAGEYPFEESTTAECPKCHHGYKANAMISHDEECFDPETGDILPED